MAESRYKTDAASAEQVALTDWLGDEARDLVQIIRAAMVEKGGSDWEQLDVTVHLSCRGCIGTGSTLSAERLDSLIAFIAEAKGKRVPVEVD